MSTVERPPRRTLPPLIAGQRLDRATFHERYAAMPPRTRAELIGGIVHMPSPLGYEHGDRDSEVSDWLGHYKRYTKGIEKPLNATTQLGDYGEHQPDCQLIIPGDLGGQTRFVGSFIVGPPELIVEIGKTTRETDLGATKDDYERAGVLEYLFVGIDPDEVLWFIRRDGRFVEMEAGADGLLRSEVFPGLWLDPAALLARDMDAVYVALDRGIATPEHAAFAARLGGRN